MDQPRPTGRPCQTISKAYAHTVGEDWMIMIREDPNRWGSVVEEKLELHEGAYRGLKKTAPVLNLRKDTGRSTSRFNTIGVTLYLSIYLPYKTLEKWCCMDPLSLQHVQDIPGMDGATIKTKNDTTQGWPQDKGNNGNAIT
eukprot:scaffold1869_cov122-Cylindrotheca_fusiformis.AAC.34